MNKRLTSRYPSITVAACAATPFEPGHPPLCLPADPTFAPHRSDGYAVGTLLLLVIVIPLRAGSAGAWALRPVGCAALVTLCCYLLLATCH